jgi:hydrogenase nickel incorporation protein HypA/HybF
VHELYIAQSILNSVSASLPKDVKPEAVTEVRVQVGQLDAVVAETLRFSFNAIKSTCGMTRAELSIEEIPVKCLCRDCAHTFSLDLPIFVCPQCRSGRVDVLQGRGITLTAILVDDPKED